MRGQRPDSSATVPAGLAGTASRNGAEASDGGRIRGLRQRDRAAPEHGHRRARGHSRSRRDLAGAAGLAGDTLGDQLDRQRHPAAAIAAMADRVGGRGHGLGRSNGIMKVIGRPIAASNSLRADLAVAVLAGAVGDDSHLAGRVVVGIIASCRNVSRIPESDKSVTRTRLVAAGTT